MKCEKLLRKPYLYVGVGRKFTYKGKTYKCVIRPEVPAPYLACSGCAFRGCSCPPRLQCSKYDRRDKRFVWFEIVETKTTKK